MIRALHTRMADMIALASMAATASVLSMIVANPMARLLAIDTEPGYIGAGLLAIVGFAATVHAGKLARSLSSRSAS